MNALHAESVPVCSSCTADPHLARSIIELGESSICSYCGRDGATVPLRTLTELVDGPFCEHFRIVPKKMFGVPINPPRVGRPLRDCLADMAKISTAIADDIVKLLVAKHDTKSELEGKPSPYQLGEQYEVQPAYAFQEEIAWEQLVERVTRHTRYFNREVENTLSNLFVDIHETTTAAGEPVVSTIEPSDAEFSLYRGRYATSKEQLHSFLRQPVRELGPPPYHLARAGRMNAAGIRSFYGGTTREVCISEIRPPVGSHVVVGRFNLMRRVRLLDLQALEDAVARLESYFEPAISLRRSRAEFLQTLAERVSQPVMPNEEAIEYIPTQVVAGFLAQRIDPPIDGMLYASTQYGSAGRNIVLFNHSSVVAAAADEVCELYYDRGYTLTMKTRLAEVTLRPAENAATDFFSPNGIEKPWIDSPEPTLSLDLDSLTVHRIDATIHEQYEKAIPRENARE